MAKIRRRAGISTLQILSVLLIASGAVRIAANAEPANANETGASPVEMTAAAPEAPNPDALLAAFQEREEKLSQRERLLAERMQALRVAELEIQDKMTALVAAEERLAATIARAESAAATDLGQLTTVYENMKPKEAAALFEEMPPQFAAGFLGMMSPEAAALIMTQLDPETAYSFSVVLAGRNANVPTQ